MRETPTILDAGHAHTVYGLGNLNQGTSVASSMTVGHFAALPYNQLSNLSNLNNGLHPASQGIGGIGQWNNGQQQAGNVYASMVALKQQAQQIKDTPALHTPKQKEEPMTTTRRLVQVLIADPDENVPLENSLLYTGEQKLTDLTDQELFFEIDIKSILDKYNAKRVTFINKKVKERTEQLEPARIRDLKMVVVTVAVF